MGFLVDIESVINKDRSPRYDLIVNAIEGFRIIVRLGPRLREDDKVNSISIGFGVRGYCVGPLGL